jgi:hypothetical protein
MPIILLVIAYIILEEVQSKISFREDEKHWLDNSFEFNGYRFNKQFYEIKNGRLLER